MAREVDLLALDAAACHAPASNASNSSDANHSNHSLG
jgi:hypothetical protein